MSYRIHTADAAYVQVQHGTDEEIDKNLGSYEEVDPESGTNLVLNDEGNQEAWVLVGDRETMLGLADRIRAVALAHVEPGVDNVVQDSTPAKVVVRNGADQVVASIEVEDEGEPDEDADDNALRLAAVAWNYMTHATYHVDGRSFTASECAEWWA